MSMINKFSFLFQAVRDEDGAAGLHHVGIGEWSGVVEHIGLGAYPSAWFQYQSHAVKLSFNLANLII